MPFFKSACENNILKFLSFIDTPKIYAWTAGHPLSLAGGFEPRLPSGNRRSIESITPKLRMQSGPTWFPPAIIINLLFKWCRIHGLHCPAGYLYRGASNAVLDRPEVHCADALLRTQSQERQRTSRTYVDTAPCRYAMRVSSR